jgi:hypothetical protein
MTPEAELAACKQALDQYRRAWRELGAALRTRTEPIPRPAFAADLMAEIGRKHALPPMPWQPIAGASGEITTEDDYEVTVTDIHEPTKTA